MECGALVTGSQIENMTIQAFGRERAKVRISLERIVTKLYLAYSISMSSHKPYSSYEAMSFDIYGTLVDWETGISASLSQLTSKLPDSHPCKHSLHDVIEVFNKYENRLLAENPEMVYEEVLKQTYLLMAREWGVETTEKEAESTGNSIPQWEAFPDTVAAMQALGKKYKLVALSNISRSAWAKTASGPLKDVKFDAVYRGKISQRDFLSAFLLATVFSSEGNVVDFSTS